MTARSSLFVAALFGGSFLSAGSARADTYVKTYSNITYGTFTDQTGYYIAGKDGDSYEFKGSFSLRQTVLGSTDSAAPWSAPFATLTSSDNHITVSYDITVTIPTKGYAAWIDLNEFTQDGLEICTRTPSGGGTGGGAVVESRTLLWYTPNGSPFAVISK